MKTIAVEDLATALISEFAKDNPMLFNRYGYIRPHSQMPKSHHDSYGTKNRLRFLKLNYKARRKLVEKTLDKLFAKGK